MCVCVWAKAKSGTAEQEAVIAEVNEVKAWRRGYLNDGDEMKCSVNGFAG